MSSETVIGLIFSLIVAGGVLIVMAALRHRTKVLEMVHRERLAMIERGIGPSSNLSASPAQESPTGRSARSTKLLSAGIVIVGLGLGLATLIGFASREPELAVGIGGAVAILGAALIVTALVVHGGGRGESDPGSASASRSARDPRSFPTDPSV